MAASPANPEAAGAAPAEDDDAAVVVTLAALEDEVRPPPEEAANAPQILAGAVVVVAAEEAVAELPPFPPLFRLAAKEASPLSAAVLALPADRDLLPSPELEVEEEGGSFTLEELRDFPGDLRASAEGVIVTFPSNNSNHFYVLINYDTGFTAHKDRKKTKKDTQTLSLSLSLSRAHTHEHRGQ